MSPLLDLEGQIRELADSEFAHTVPVGFAPEPERRNRRWFGAAAAAVIVAGGIAVQLMIGNGALVASVTDEPSTRLELETPVAPDRSEDTNPTGPFTGVPPMARQSESVFTTLTTGDGAVLLSGGAVWATTDRGQTWDQQLAGQFTFCPDGMQTVVEHGESLVLLGASSDLSPSQRGQKSMYMSTDLDEWRELRLPTQLGADHSTICGIASDGERLVVVHLDEGQIEMLIFTNLMGERPGAFQELQVLRPDGARSGNEDAGFASVHHHDGKWIVSACALRTGWFREGEPPCTIEAWEVAFESIMSATVQPLGQAHRLHVLPDGVWISGIFGSVIDDPPLGFPPLAEITELLEESEDGTFLLPADPGVVSGQPWAIRLDQEATVDTNGRLPAGLSSDVRLQRIAGETFAIVTQRRRLYGGDPSTTWLRYADGVWIETEPVVPIPWEGTDTPEPFTIDRWTLVGWPEEDSDLQIEIVDRTYEPIDHDALTMITTLGHVSIAATDTDELAFRPGGAADWRLFEPEDAFGANLESIDCLAVVEHQFHALVTVQGRDDPLLYRTTALTNWSRVPDRLSGPQHPCL